DRVDGDVGLAERSDQRLEPVPERDLDDEPADPDERVVVREAIRGRLRQVAREPRLDPRPAREQVPGDDEAVAAVVARPADDEDPLAARGSVEELTLDHVGRPAAGVLHQDEARDAALVDRERVEGAHLRAREDRDQADAFLDSRTTTATATPASCVML